jgi:NAD(P)-dependent dehydrogenase (short-subunit alcohol dehydrogenase family)
MRKVFITGVSRGLGLGFSKALLESGSRVAGTVRKKSSEIIELEHQFPDALTLIQWEAGTPVDVNQLNQIPSSFWAEGDRTFDWIISNAGVKPSDPSTFPQDLCGEDILEAVKVNVVGPLELVKALVPDWTHQGSKVVHISTSIASLAQPMAGYATAYATSKTALNMLSLHLKPWLDKHIGDFLLLHPGWVKTDMGGNRAPLTIQDSVQGMIHVIETHSPTDPLFLDYTGASIPW